MKAFENADELLMYLEQCLVLDKGFIDTKQLNKANQQTVFLWSQQELLSLEKLNGAKQVITGYTHKMRFSRELYERAWDIRQKQAEIHSPTLNPAKQKTWTVDRDEAAALPPGDEREVPEYEPHFEGFETFLSSHNNGLTPVQGQLAKDLFRVFEKPEYRFFIHASHSGKTWLLKAIDQYFTSFLKNSKNRVVKKPKDDQFKIEGVFKARKKITNNNVKVFFKNFHSLLGHIVSRMEATDLPDSEKKEIDLIIESRFFQIGINEESLTEQKE